MAVVVLRPRGVALELGTEEGVEGVAAVLAASLGATEERVRGRGTGGAGSTIDWVRLLRVFALGGLLEKGSTTRLSALRRVDGCLAFRPVTSGIGAGCLRGASALGWMDDVRGLRWTISGSALPDATSFRPDEVLPSRRLKKDRKSVV